MCACYLHIPSCVQAHQSHCLTVRTGFVRDRRSGHNGGSPDRSHMPGRQCAWAYVLVREITIHKLTHPLVTVQVDMHVHSYFNAYSITETVQHRPFSGLRFQSSGSSSCWMPRQSHMMGHLMVSSSVKGPSLKRSDSGIPIGGILTREMRASSPRSQAGVTDNPTRGKRHPGFRLTEQGPSARGSARGARGRPRAAAAGAASVFREGLDVGELLGPLFVALRVDVVLARSGGGPGPGPDVSVSAASASGSPRRDPRKPLPRSCSSCPLRNAR